MRQGLSRREAMKAAAAGAVVACGPKGEDDTGTAPGSVEHVIFVMMENRSFDHWLGARKLLEGKAEDGLTDGLSNPDDDGNPVFPFPSEDPCLIDPPHGWGASHNQFNDGANDGFVKEYAPRCSGDGSGVMAYQQRSDLPITWALADAYLVCDRWFASVMGPTWPNRLFAHGAESEGKMDNSTPDTGTFTMKTVWEALDEVGVDWAYYYTDVPFIGLFEDHWDPARILLLDDFLVDCQYGLLPPVVWVDPAFSYNDNHPPHHPLAGELFLATVFEAIATSPLWDKCVVIVAYDEHGGFFDHVPPPTTEDDRASNGFDQLGFRVPTLAIGPWVKQGVDSTVYDHCSWIRYVCEKHGAGLWNTRLQAATSAASLLDEDRMAAGEPLPPIELPAVDFDNNQIDPGCMYRPARPWTEQVERLAQAHGLATRLGDGAAIYEGIRRAARKRGVLG